MVKCEGRDYFKGQLKVGFVFHAKELGLYHISNGESLKIPNWSVIQSDYILERSLSLQRV